MEHYEALGQVSWLWMNSRLHQDWPMHSAARFILPAVALGQYELVIREDRPVAYCSWAFFDLEAEHRYIQDPSSVELKDWRSGDRMWILEWITPFAARDAAELKKRLKSRFSSSVARAIRVKPDSRRARVMQLRGPEVTAEAARARHDGFHREFVEHYRAEAARPAAAQRAPDTASR